MTSSARAFAVLDLFSSERPVWHTDDINAALDYSRATGYRYVKDLVEAGFLQKVAAGYYALGARIIELDYQLRQSDPVLLAAVPVMDDLAARSHLDVVLSAMFGSRVVDTHHASAGASLDLEYGRGRPRPLFSGAAPKILLAHQSRTALSRLYKTHAKSISTMGLGNSWKQFRDQMTQLRSAGMYLSLGEVERGIGAAAAPLFNADGEAVAALSVVGKASALKELGEPRLRKWLDTATDQIQKRLKRNQR